MQEQTGASPAKIWPNCQPTTTGEVKPVHTVHTKYTHDIQRFQHTRYSNIRHEQV